MTEEFLEDKMTFWIAPSSNKLIILCPTFGGHFKCIYRPEFCIFPLDINTDNFLPL